MTLKTRFSRVQRLARQLMPPRRLVIALEDGRELPPDVRASLRAGDTVVIRYIPCGFLLSEESPAY